MYTNPYNIKNLSDGLQELASQLKGTDITEIAALEQLHVNTVRAYLKGENNITTPAVGKAILDRGRKIVIKREQGSSAKSQAA